MNLWIGGECEKEVYDVFRITRNKVERLINAKLSESEFANLELPPWRCIAIIRSDTRFEEIVKYSLKRNQMDFRLKIESAVFAQSDEAGRISLIVGMLDRSLSLLEEKGAPSQPIAKLRALLRGIT